MIPHAAWPPVVLFKQQKERSEQRNTDCSESPESEETAQNNPPSQLTVNCLSRTRGQVVPPHCKHPVRIDRNDGPSPPRHIHYGMYINVRFPGKVPSPIERFQQRLPLPKR
eukprot:5022963-Heterocapsa_arctica.AAC.1